MENNNEIIQFNNLGWPAKWTPLPSSYIVFPFLFDFSKSDLEFLRTNHANTGFGFRCLYVSDSKIFIYRGGKCFYQLKLSPGSISHIAVQYVEYNVDKIISNQVGWIKPQETLIKILSNWLIDKRPANELHQRHHKAVDIHSHVLFGMDDGATDIDMSIAMLYQLYVQGVTDVFCSSHSWGHHIDSYWRNLKELRVRIEETGLEINLHTGCEILCEKNSFEKVLKKLEHKEYLSLAGSKYILLEYAPWASAKEIIQYARAFLELTEHVPVIAHAERYECLRNDLAAYNELKNRRIPIQVNAYSLSEEQNAATKELARRFLDDNMVTFIGSDAHRTDHRPPIISSCVEYIYDTCDKEYADAVCFKNAEQLLIGKKQN